MFRNLDFITIVEPDAKSLKPDQTLMTKEEFFKRIEEAEKQADRGEGMEIMPGEDLAHFLNRNGYAV